MALRFAEWEVWSTHVQIGASNPSGLDRAVTIAHEVIAEVTVAASRFEPGTEILRVNSAAGEWVEVSPTMITLAREALRVAELTDGLVTPLIGRSLLGIGYDTDISRVGGGKVTVFPVENDWQRLEINGSRIRIPAHAMLDLGASAKAWSCDRIASTASNDATAVLVGIGGDIAVAGSQQDGFLVEVSERPVHQDGDAPDEQVRIDAGGLATSTTVVRRWQSSDSVVHHIIDPRTALPATTVYRTVTVAAASCADANAASTASIILAAAAPLWLQSAGLPARLVRNDGEVLTVGDWPDAAE